MKFELITKLTPKGDQQQAIDKISEGILKNKKYQTLLGVTGSGKTFTMANIIKNVNKPTLVISHNKTLAAQLYSEFKEFFPNNAVRYFVSYYDYYQPEAYIPQRDIYIEKDASINEDLDRLRLSATSSLVSRKDVIIVASVSCIYNIGSPEEYEGMIAYFKKGQIYERNGVVKRLIEMQYQRNDYEFKRGNFSVKGDVMEIFPSYEESALRVEFSDDIIEKLESIHNVTKETICELDEITIYPAKHFIVSEDKIEKTIKSIEEELEYRVKELREQGKILESQRLLARTKFDIEQMRLRGYCKGIENYSRHLSGRLPGQRPYCLLDYFQKDFLCFVDESHVTIPQLRGMYNGDRSRKEVLIEYGFRLPSALDNRPMRFDEWEATINQVVFVSATPSPFELKKSNGVSAEQIIRPTGLVDPDIEVRKTKNQIPDLIEEMKKRVKNKERVLVTTLTKKLAELLSKHLQEQGVKGRYLHCDIETIERVQILRELRQGVFDVLVGVNLLREGLDLPEVSLVAILDADKEGFLRSEISLIQTIGRTARNVNGKVIMYADKMTSAMKKAIAETQRRRKIQIEYNKRHNITPKTIEKEIKKGIEEEVKARKIEMLSAGFDVEEYESTEMIKILEKEMYECAERLQFEKAAYLRDMIRDIVKSGATKEKNGKHRIVI